MMSLRRPGLNRYQCHNHKRNNEHGLKKKTKNTTQKEANEQNPTPLSISTQPFHSNPLLKEGVQQAEEPTQDLC